MNHVCGSPGSYKETCEYINILKTDNGWENWKCEYFRKSFLKLNFIRLRYQTYNLLWMRPGFLHNPKENNPTVLNHMVLVVNWHHDFWRICIQEIFISLYQLCYCDVFRTSRDKSLCLIRHVKDPLSQIFCERRLMHFQ